MAIVDTVPCPPGPIFCLPMNPALVSIVVTVGALLGGAPFPVWCILVMLWYSPVICTLADWVLLPYGVVQGLVWVLNFRESERKVQVEDSSLWCSVVQCSSGCFIAVSPSASTICAVDTVASIVTAANGSEETRPGCN